MKLHGIWLSSGVIQRWEILYKKVKFIARKMIYKVLRLLSSLWDQSSVDPLWEATRAAWNWRSGQIDLQKKTCAEMLWFATDIVVDSCTKEARMRRPNSSLASQAMSLSWGRSSLNAGGRGNPAAVCCNADGCCPCEV